MDIMQQACEKFDTYNGREQFAFFMWWRSTANDDASRIRFDRISNSVRDKLDGFDWNIILIKLNEYEGEKDGYRKNFEIRS